MKEITQDVVDTIEYYRLLVLDSIEHVNPIIKGLCNITGEAYSKCIDIGLSTAVMYPIYVGMHEATYNTRVMQAASLHGLNYAVSVIRKENPDKSHKEHVRMWREWAKRVLSRALNNVYRELSE